MPLTGHLFSKSFFVFVKSPFDARQQEGTNSEMCLSVVDIRGKLARIVAHSNEKN